MKRLRSLAVLFLAVYLLFSIGVQFHSHHDERQVHPHCNLCQAANVPFGQTPNCQAVIELRTFGIIELLKPAFLIIPYSAPRAGRDPPIA